MVDVVKLRLQAGNGGDGRISFHRSRFRPKGGPNGGDGGDGGSVILVGDRNMHTLRDFAGKNEIAASHGGMGGVERSFGKKGEDLYIHVPEGTIAWKIKDTYRPLPKRMYWNDEEGERHQRGKNPRRIKPEPILIVTPEATYEKERVFSFGEKEVETEIVGQVVIHGQELVVAQGGRGGRGNWHFKSSTHTTPKEAETGSEGQRGEFVLELQVLADVGFIGFPNVGKSTLLSVLTSAAPKIANYPFTTLEPNLGVLEFPSNNPAKRDSLLLADIPGIIEGASEGKGLGIEFLRHISRCKALLYVVAVDENLGASKENPIQDLSNDLHRQITTLRHELDVYQTATQEGKKRTELAIPIEEKNVAYVVNKCDLLAEERLDALMKEFKVVGSQVFFISGKTRQGLDDLSSYLRSIVE